MVPAEALTQVLARLHTGVGGTLELLEQRCSEHPGAATGVENALYRQADVVRVRGDEPAPVTGFDRGGNGGSRVEVEALVVGAVEGHGSSRLAVGRARQYMKGVRPRQTPRRGFSKLDRVLVASTIAARAQEG